MQTVINVEDLDAVMSDGLWEYMKSLKGSALIQPMTIKKVLMGLERQQAERVSF